MSIRAFLYANYGTERKELAESKTWVPLCWLTLLATDDAARANGDGHVTFARKDAIDRCARSVPFLTKLFPEFRSTHECADALLDLLRKTRAATLGIDLVDHFAIAPETFPQAFLAAVEAIETRNEKCSFAIPARQVPNPFTGKPKTIRATTLRTTRDLLCHTAGLEPVTDDEDIERDQLVGCLLP
jgi:hypothetical protein